MIVDNVNQTSTPPSFPCHIALSHSLFKKQNLFFVIYSYIFVCLFLCFLVSFASMFLLFVSLDGASELPGQQGGLHERLPRDGRGWTDRQVGGDGQG